MVYGSTLTVPGTFVGPNRNPDAAEHLERMRSVAGRLVPAPDAWHGTKTTAITKGLEEAEYVFVRRDAAHGPLKTPYSGPYKVLQKQGKYFVIQCGEREESVSVDRLKPAKADPDRPTEPAMPPRRGRPPKQREERAAAERSQAEASLEPEQEQPPQIVRAGNQTGKNSEAARQIHSNHEKSGQQKLNRQTLEGSSVASPKRVARLRSQSSPYTYEPVEPAAVVYFTRFSQK